MKDLIQLQQANMFQETVKGSKTDWLIRENETNEVLFTLPSTISDKDMFALMRMAKQFELIAFNRGVEYGKTL